MRSLAYASPQLQPSPDQQLACRIKVLSVRPCCKKPIRIVVIVFFLYTLRNSFVSLYYFLYGYESKFYLCLLNFTLMCSKPIAPVQRMRYNCLCNSYNIIRNNNSLIVDVFIFTISVVHVFSTCITVVPVYAGHAYLFTQGISQFCFRYSCLIIVV